MASQIQLQNVSVPSCLVTSENCAAMPIAWDYSYGTPETTFRAGDVVVIDKEPCPIHGDVVVMKRAGREPFGRQCYIAPCAADPRERWIMGVLDDEGNTHFLKLGEYEWFGVVNGKVPARMQG